MNFFNNQSGKKESESSAPVGVKPALPFTSVQIAIMTIWLSPPLIIFLSLWLLSPEYIDDFFTDEVGIIMLSICAIAEALNAVTLVGSFWLINLMMPPNGTRQALRVITLSLVSTITFMLFTLTPCIIIILAPAAIQIMRSGL